MKEIITAQEAGRILLIPGQAVREHIKRGIPPFDHCGRVVSQTGKRKQYLIYTRKLLKAFEISEEEAEKRI